MVSACSDCIGYLDAAAEYALVAGDWGRMGKLIESAFESNECAWPSWWAAALYHPRSRDEVLELWRKTGECDPLAADQQIMVEVGQSRGRSWPGRRRAPLSGRSKLGSSRLI